LPSYCALVVSNLGSSAYDTLSLVIGPTTELSRNYLMNQKRNRYDGPDTVALDTSAKKFKFFVDFQHGMNDEDEGILEPCSDQIIMNCGEGIEKDYIPSDGSEFVSPTKAVVDQVVTLMTPHQVRPCLMTYFAGYNKPHNGGVLISKLTIPKPHKESHQRRVDEYFSIPMTSLSGHSEIFDMQYRPSTIPKLCRSDGEAESSQERAEPTTVEDTCQCCFRLVSDLTISHRCSFCMKVGCLECMNSCELCIEFFCSHCSTKNYSSTYERILCLDCDGNG
jgi:Cd27 binding protein (Siva)